MDLSTKKQQFSTEDEVQLLAQLMSTVDLACSPKKNIRLSRTSTPIPSRKNHQIKCSRLRNVVPTEPSYARWVENLEKIELTKVSLRGVSSPINGIISGHLITTPPPAASTSPPTPVLLDRSFCSTPKQIPINDVTPKSVNSRPSLLKARRLFPIFNQSCKNLAKQFVGIFKNKKHVEEGQSMNDRECKIMRNFLGHKEPLIVNFEDVSYDDQVYVNVKV